MTELFPIGGAALTRRNQVFHRRYPLSARDTDLKAGACPFELIVEALGR